MLDKNIWQYTAFKNIRGSLSEGYVTDVLYFAEMMPVLYSSDFTKSGRNTLATNLFSNKCYFPILLKYLAMPKTVMMNINGEFLGADYEILTEDEALRRMNSFPQLVFKPATGTGHGSGITLAKREYYKQTMREYANHDRGGLCCSGSHEAT